MSRDLTESQQEDVAHIYPGPVLLLAGPGTGKTHQLARRVKWLVEQRHVAPEEITVLAFSDEAARNMRERLSDRQKKETHLPHDRQPHAVRTMHSLAFELVRENCHVLGYEEPPDLVPEHVVGILLEDAAQLVALPREAGRTQTGRCRDRGLCERDPVRAECNACDRYCRILRAHNAIDYNDMMLLACRILRDPQCQEIKQEYQTRSLHLLVDEYQDINPTQLEFIQHLAEDDPAGIYAVGDDNQSIYAFRGATPEYIRRFQDRWPGAKIRSLPESRRCPQAVLDAAAAVVARGSPGALCSPHISSASPASDIPDKVTKRRVPSEYLEATDIAAKVAQERGARDALILVPDWRYAPLIKRALRERRISYDCRTQVDRTGLHLVAECGRWLSEADDFALRSCLQAIAKSKTLDDLGRPRRGVKKWEESLLGYVAGLWDIADAQGTSLLDALASAPDDSPLHRIRRHVDDLRAAYGQGPHAFIATASGVLGPWHDASALIAEATEWVEDARTRNRAAGRPFARVLTMRLAKGLEADLVFITGLEEDSFSALFGPEADPQERYRILYVAMTRAKQRLYLYYAQKRSGKTGFPRRAPGGYTPPQPAEFMSWLPPHAVEEDPLWLKKGSRRKRRPRRASP